jgi:uncharacterized protein (DUF1800 family)
MYLMALRSVELVHQDGTTTLPAPSFRNPVHFMPFAVGEANTQTEATLGVALHETDAVLDSYLVHPNTAPFLAARFCQRFGISNPSPRYVTAVATAFRTGSYTHAGSGLRFGKGVYGDLEAAFGAVLLDREARTSLLDADPAHGSMREPLLKVLAVMRSMEFAANADVRVFNLVSPLALTPIPYPISNPNPNPNF